MAVVNGLLSSQEPAIGTGGMQLENLINKCESVLSALLSAGPTRREGGEMLMLEC